MGSDTFISGNWNFSSYSTGTQEVQPELQGLTWYITRLSAA